MVRAPRPIGVMGGHGAAEAPLASRRAPHFRMAVGVVEVGEEYECARSLCARTAAALPRGGVLLVGCDFDDVGWRLEP